MNDLYNILFLMRLAAYKKQAISDNDKTQPLTFNF